MTKLKGTGDQPLWLDVASYLIKHDGEYFTASEIAEAMDVGLLSIQKACDMGRSYDAFDRRLRPNSHQMTYAIAKSRVADSLRKEAS